MLTLNKYLIPFNIFCIFLGSYIILFAYKKDEITNFKSISLTLKSKPEVNSTFTFYVKENNNRYILNDFGLESINRADLKYLGTLSKNQKIEFSIKKSEAHGIHEKLNGSMGIVNVYGMKTHSKAFLSLNDYINYRENENKSLLGKSIYIFICCLTLLSIHWIICMGLCVLNPKKIDIYSKSKWFNPLVVRETEIS